ncbi:hypothetical protein N7457_006847, partial [Penicillium paradoxum]|uniref:uncharacterized protein n=1 Tax=Penicillium paradoxum TaxID=176176 RepID=UPI002549A30F
EDSLVVTHPTTNSPACGLSTAERTGSPIFHTLWSEDSLVVTHPTTNSPACGLSTAERTGSPVFHTLWSYVLVKINQMLSLTLSRLYLNESIRAVDKSSWLISNTLLLTRSSAPVPDEHAGAAAIGGISSSPLHLGFSQILSLSQKIRCLFREYTQSIIKRLFSEQVKPSSRRIPWTIPIFSKTESPRGLNFHTYTIILRLARDIFSSSRGFPASYPRKLGLT